MGRGTGAPREALAGGAAGTPESRLAPLPPGARRRGQPFGQFESDDHWDVGAGRPAKPEGRTDSGGG